MGMPGFRGVFKYASAPRYASQSFASGTREITQFTIPAAGAYEITDFHTVSQGTPLTQGGASIGTNDPSATAEFSYFGNPYIQFSPPSGDFYVWFYDSGIGYGDDPMASGTSIGINLIGGMTTGDLLNSAMPDAINGAGVGATASGGGDQCTVTYSLAGAGGTPSMPMGGGSYLFFNSADSGSDATTNITAGNYITIDTPSTHYYLWFKISGSGSDPAIGGKTGVEVDINLYDDDSTVAIACANAINAIAGNPFQAFQYAGGNFRFAPNVLGNTTNATIGTATNFSVNVILDGSTTNLVPGCYFTFSSPTTNYYAWFSYPNLFQASFVGSGYIGTDPAPGGTGVAVIVSTLAENANSVCGDCIGPINAAGRFSTGRSGATLTIANLDGGNVTDGGAGTLTGAAPNVTQQGSSVIDLVANTVTITAHGFPNALPVRLTTSSATLPAPLALNTTYYIIRVDANTIAFATSSANALAGTKIDLTTTGSVDATITIRQFP